MTFYEWSITGAGIQYATHLTPNQQSIKDFLCSIIIFQSFTLHNMQYKTLCFTCCWRLVMFETRYEHEQCTKTVTDFL